MDDLTRIKGIGAATAKKLAAGGIGSFEELALAVSTKEPLVSIAKSDVEAVAWITAAAQLANVPPAQGEAKSQEKPLGSNAAPEAQLQDRAGLPADSPAGDGQQVSSYTSPEHGHREGAGDPAGPAVEAGAAGPLLKEALDGFEGQPSSIVIRSKRAGFRRAGVAHPREEVSHDLAAFSADQIEELLAEPQLSVRLA